MAHQSPDLEYLQSIFTGHQTVCTITYPHPGSDRAFAKGRRLLVTRMTQLLENRRYWSGSCKLAPGSSATVLIDLADSRICWCPAQLSNHDVTTAVLTMRCQQDGCRDYMRTPAVVMISISLLYQVLGPENWSVVNESPYWRSPF